MVRVVSLLIIALLFTACSSNKDKEDDSKVAKLVKFEKTVKMKRLWAKNTGSSKGRKYLRLQPAIDDDRIFALDAKGRVGAYSLDKGTRIWQSKTDFKISGGVGAGGGKVFFGTLDGEVVALDGETGEQVWVASTSSEILSAPATNGSIVVAQTIDARVFALDIKTGEKRWSYDHLTPVLSLRGTSGPVFTTTQVICAFDNGQIVSFSSLDGSRTWESRVGQPKGKTDLERIVDVDGTPVIDSGLVFAGSYQGNVVAFGRAKGNPMWKKTNSTYGAVAAFAGKVFVSTDRSRVIAYNAANGDVIWKNEQLLNREISSPAIISKYLAVIDDDDHLHLMSQADGSFAYRFKPKGDGFHAPMLSHRGVLYILSDDGYLSAYKIVPL